MVKDTESKARLQEELMCIFASFVLDMPLGCTTYVPKISRLHGDFSGMEGFTVIMYACSVNKLKKLSERGSKGYYTIIARLDLGIQGSGAPGLG